MNKRKPLYWVGTSKEDLISFPEEVRYDIGHALKEAQEGGKSNLAKPFKGYKGAGVLEVVERFDTNTYRAVYTIKFKECVFVLHCFQKKSPKGIETAQKDINLINARLKLAEKYYEKEF